jgi:hypothetical protein
MHMTKVEARMIHENENLHISPQRALKPSTSGYVTESHYKDRDVGAYDDIDVRAIWASFTKKHEPSHILISLDTEEGQRLSDKLLNTHKMAAALKQLVDTVNATGGVLRTEPGPLAPMADEDWLDLGLAYTPSRNSRSVVKALKVISSTEPTSDFGLVQNSPLPKSVISGRDGSSRLF